MTLSDVPTIFYQGFFLATRDLSLCINNSPSPRLNLNKPETDE